MSTELGMLDAGALLVLLFFGVMGGVKGAVRILFGLLALAAGHVLAARFGGELEAETWPVVKGFDDPVRVGGLVGCGVIFVASMIAGVVLGRMARKALSDSNLGGMDRLVGLLLGLAQGVLWVTGIVIVLKALSVSSLDEQLEGTMALEATRDIATSARGVASDKIQDFINATLDLPAEDV